MTTKSNIVILGLRIYDRIQEADKVQKLLTEYGCFIKTRLGLHEVNDNFCSQSGFILLELFGDKLKQDELENNLNNIKGVEVKKMEFEK